MKLGLDIGSGNLKAVCLDNNQTYHASLERNPVAGVGEFIRSLSDEKIELGLTGINSPAIAELFGVERVLDAVAVVRAIRKLHPDARTVFDIGQERASFYGLRSEAESVEIPQISPCGAGGGALIEKMTRRLGFSSLDEFVNAALSAENPARMAGRCAVFAESDVVHESNKGRRTDEIAAGLCQMLARNFVTNVCGDREISDPIYLLGGVGKSRAFVNFLEQQLGKKVIVPANFLDVKAYGAALSASGSFTKEELLEKLGSYQKPRVSTMKPLNLVSPRMTELPYTVIDQTPGRRVLLSADKNYKLERGTGVYLGLDVGSVSTKAALVDEDGRFILGLYLRTSGRPIDAVKDVIGRIGNLDYQGRRVKDMVRVFEAGVTGSGRAVAARIIGDKDVVVKNEITAQARGARYFLPEVDTVFEIGGQDSKYIFVQAGEVVDNEMNKSCAASTGSFLEEQANVLRISIERQFADLALRSRSPVNLSDKCAVFMTSSLLAHHDASVEDRCAGLAYSICMNYLNRVAKKGQVGERIAFQGAVAFNQAVVAGFETLLGRRIWVPEYPHLTGAIGIACVTKDIYEAR